MAESDNEEGEYVKEENEIDYTITLNISADINLKKSKRNKKKKVKVPFICARTGAHFSFGIVSSKVGSLALTKRSGIDHFIKTTLNIHETIDKLPP